MLVLLAVVTWPLCRRFLENLGARPDERARVWPGDRLLPGADSRATRAVSVRAPVAAVWPWLLQFGIGRGGFHSYELLERLGGIDIRNLERIRPELQTLAVGEEIKLHPTAPGLTVALLEPNAHVCYRTWRDEKDLTDRDPDMVGSFSLYLVATSADSCRLLVRTCKQERWPRTRTARILGAWFEDPLDLVMEWRMLRTIRRLAEHRPA